MRIETPKTAIIRKHQDGTFTVTVKNCFGRVVAESCGFLSGESAMKYAIQHRVSQYINWND